MIRNTASLQTPPEIEVYRDITTLDLITEIAWGELKPNETKTVDFSLDRKALSFYDPLKKKWVTEPGEFKLLIGSSSRDIRLEGTFSLI